MSVIQMDHCHWWGLVQRHVLAYFGGFLQFSLCVCVCVCVRVCVCVSILFNQNHSKIAKINVFFIDIN